MPFGHKNTGNSGPPPSAWRLAVRAGVAIIELGLEVVALCIRSPHDAAVWWGMRGKQTVALVRSMASNAMEGIGWWFIPANLPFSIKAPAFVVGPLVLGVLLWGGFTITPSLGIAFLGLYGAGIWSLVMAVRIFRAEFFRRNPDSEPHAGSIRDRADAKSLPDGWAEHRATLWECAVRNRPAEFDEAMERFARSTETLRDATARPKP
ncbi:MAG: hypothetical protein U1G08_19960 [Verrucomicrobiota bacterium]